jgi:DNA polymerase-3 subunit epsilon
MKITVWDTETTGFATRWGDLSQQPYIIQFAALEVEYDEGAYTELSRHNFVMKPPVSIPFWASQVHGIFDKDVADKNPIKEHIDDIIRVLNRAEILSWHNIEYDEEILSYELARLGRSGDYVPQSILCTMRSSTEYCKLQGRGFSYKPPKLSELHKHLFGEWFEWAHDAMVDVEATMRCLIELLNRKVVQPETTNLMRLF